MYVYKQSGPKLFTVGFYDPQGKWIPESDHVFVDKAASRVAWLNGSSAIDIVKRAMERALVLFH